MTQGTSPHGEALSSSWADAGQCGWDWQRIWDTGRRRLSWRATPLPPPPLSAAVGLGAGLALAAAWHAVADVGPYLPLLIAAGTAAACIGLSVCAAVRAAAPTADRSAPAAGAPSRLLAQMQHDLRTPLNAVIGFSAAMQHELHGPLGNHRYQEYAAHISESGGRLLKASEDALAVAATLSALLTDRPALRRDRLPVTGLLEEAWAAVAAPGVAARLDTERCGAAEIACDWQTTSQALQLLLGEARGRSGAGRTIVASVHRERGARLLELTIGCSCSGTQAGSPISPQPGIGLRLILARSLLALQGATLSIPAEPQPDAWQATIAFPAVAAGRRPRPRVTKCGIEAPTGSPLPMPASGMGSG